MLRPRSPLPYSLGEARPSPTRPRSPSASHPGASHPVANLDGSPLSPPHSPASYRVQRPLPPSQQWGCLPSLLVPHPLLPRLIQPWPWRLFGPLPSGGTALDAGPAKPQEAALFCPPLDKAPPSLLREGRPALPALLGALIPRLVLMTALPEGSSPLWAGQHSPTGELSIHLPLPLEPPPSTSWAPWGCGKQGGSPELGRSHVQPQEVGGGFRPGATKSQHPGELWRPWTEGAGQAWG